MHAVRVVTEVLVTLAIAALLAVLLAWPAIARAGDDPATATLAELATLLPCAQPDAPLEECVTRDTAEHWLLGHEGEAYLAYDWACVDVRAGGRTCVRAPMAPRLEPAR